MFACPSCAAPVGPSDRSCPACGSGVDIAESPTGTAPRPGAPLSPTPSPGLERTPSGGARRPVGERFVPGTVLAGRYRITGLLGRGGMGEVYRADDLKLEQPVALKFLPHGLDADEERLARFYREVRVARQVSHPAVCRVYDVGEAEGHLFLSMEMVDGENLASLLRRIGRLPPDKATRHRPPALRRASPPRTRRASSTGTSSPRTSCSTARATCASPTSAWPASRSSLREEDVRSGTPCYMSPEQLQGREVSVRSDIYALGLVLYELYTGRRAFQGKSLAEFVRKHRDERPIEPSALVAGLDPAVERAILACLEKEPRRRPSSALVVSAMLTGSDPLEAAIAAGETPSPELVAAAGEAEGLRPAVAWGLLAVVLAGLALVPLAGRSFRLLERVPVGKPPAVLEDRARDLVRRVARDRARDRRRVGPLRGLELPGRGAGEGQVALALGRPRLGEPSGPAVLVPREPAAARVAPAEREGLRDEARARRDRHGGRHLRHGGAPPALLPRPRAARGRRGRTGLRGPGLVAPPRGGAARPGRPARGRAEVGSPLLRRRPRRVGGDLAGSPRRPHPGRGRRPPREARVVRGRVAVDAARADGEVRLAGGEAPEAGAVAHALAAPPRRGLLHGPPQHRARAGGPAGGLPGRAAARGGRHPLLGARGPPRGRLGRRVEPRRPRGGHGRAPGGVRVALLPRGRALRAAAAPLDPRVVDAVPRRRARRPGGRPGHARRPRLGRAPVRPRAAALRPPGLRRPAPARPDGRLPGPAPRRRSPRSARRWAWRARPPSSPWGRCCSSSSPACSSGGTPWPPRPSSCSCSRPGPRRAASRRGSRCP